MNKMVFSKISKIAKQFDSKENKIQSQNGQYSYRTSNLTEISKLKKRPAHSVLIVDNNIEMCLMFKYFLYKKGFGIDTAGTGQEALRKLRNRVFNVVLLDIKLPGIEGVELVPYLKEIYPDIGVIIIADCLETINAINLLNNEASYYLTKPVNFGEIADKVKEIIQKQRLTVIRNKLLEISHLDLIKLEGNYKEKNRAYV
ncbi:MAG: response regulator [bacterium]|nr:response regulator [bacterium]